MKLLRPGALLLLLLVGGCDAFEGLVSRLLDDPTRMVRVTTRSGESVVVMQPQLDYLHAIGAGRYDRGAFIEGLGLRTTEGLMEWEQFSALTLRPSRSSAREAADGGESVHEAEVRLKNGVTVAKALSGTPSRGIAGWRKAGDLPASSGYVWVEIPLGTVARIELLDSVRERVPSREYHAFRVTARRRTDSACTGAARLYHPLPVQPDVHVSHDDGALGFRVEERGILLEVDLRDLREVAIDESRGGKAVASFTFNNGERRTYPTRSAYFEMHTSDPACRRIGLSDLRSIHIAGLE